MPQLHIHLNVVRHAKSTLAYSTNHFMTKFLTAFFLSLTLVSCAQSKTKSDKDKERIDNVCDKFMQTFASGQIPEALQLLKQNTVMDPSSIDTVQKTIEEQARSIFPTYGKMRSSEFIVERRVKDFIAKRFYILKFDKYFLKFDFTLYNSDSSW